MSGNNISQLVNESGRHSGFNNMLHEDNNRWWGRSRQWLLHGWIWLLLEFLLLFCGRYLPLRIWTELKPGWPQPKW